MAATARRDNGEVVVLGAGYSGLTTAAELALRGHGPRVRIVAQSLGSAPPITIVGTQVCGLPSPHRLLASPVRAHVMVDARTYDVATVFI